jgi:hypothetical protein
LGGGREKQQDTRSLFNSERRIRAAEERRFQPNPRVAPRLKRKRGTDTKNARLTKASLCCFLAPPLPPLHPLRYLQIGACRHGDRCSRLHNKPTLSQTILMSNMYQSPEAALAAGAAGGAAPAQIDPRQLQEHFEDFYEDIFEELATFGEIEVGRYKLRIQFTHGLTAHLVP